MIELVGQPELSSGRRLRAGRYVLERRRDGRWGASDGKLGVGGHRTPYGAVLGLARFRRLNARQLRRANLDHAASLLLGLTYRIEVETDLYLRNGRRDVERLAEVHRQVEQIAWQIRKQIGGHP